VSHLDWFVFFRIAQQDTALHFVQINLHQNQITSTLQGLSEKLEP
jgi:hypothetical protein